MKTPVPPLKELIVLELAGSPAAAFACSLLADFGATVYVVEPPPHGSALRNRGSAAAREAWWQSIARNKYSVAIDAGKQEAGPVIDAMLSHADLVVTDIGPGAWSHDPWMSRISTSDEAPLAIDLFATGIDSPRTWVGGIAPELTGAATGMMNLTGWPDRAPVAAEAPIADYFAGTMAAMGAMAELRARRQSSNKRAHLSMATHEAVQRMIEWQVPVAALLGRPERRNGNNFPMNAAISNMHRTGDGKFVAISAANQGVALRLLRLIGGEALATDERFSTPKARAANMALIYAAIDAWVGARAQEEVIALAHAADVVIGPIFDVSDILANPHIRERRNLVTLDSSDGQSRTVSAVLPRISGYHPPPLRPAPEIGEHTRAALAAIGMEQDRYERLVERSVIWAAAATALKAEVPA